MTALGGRPIVVYMLGCGLAPDTERGVSGMTIRDLSPSDMDRLPRIFAAGDRAPLSVLKDLLRKSLEKTGPDRRPAPDDYFFQVFAGEDGGALGFAATQVEDPGEFNLCLYVEPSHRSRGIGRALYEESIASLRASDDRPRGGDDRPRAQGPGRVTVRYRSDPGAPGPVTARDFYARRGYKVWYAMDELIHRGSQPKIASDGPDTARHRSDTGARRRGVSIRPYEDGYYEAYTRVMGDAFEPMRAAKDFRPHNVYQLNSPERRREFREMKDNIFLLFEGEVLVGECRVDGDFVDEVGVAPAYQGRGYGRILTEFCLDLVRERGYPEARTSVLVDNRRARDLYYGLGFELVQTNEWATRPILPEPPAARSARTG